MSAKPKSHLNAIKETLEQEHWKAIQFKRGPGKISFQPEISIDVANAAHWSLNVTVHPNQGKLDEHSHYFLQEQDIVELHAYLSKMLDHLKTLK